MQKRNLSFWEIWNMFELVKLESELDVDAVTIKIKKEVGKNATSEIKLIDLHIENLEKEVQFVYVNGIKYTGKNYMHLEKLNIPVRFDQNETIIKIEFN